MNEIELLNSTPSPSNSRFNVSSTGKIMIGITGGIAIGLTVICAPFVSPALRKHCLPYIPATNQQMANILDALKGRKGTLLDIGSGDGRIVLETAKNKFDAHGIELNPWLVLYSKVAAIRQGLGKQTKFFRQDLWKYNVAKYDNIIIFGVEQMMTDLENKFLQECKSDCRILACRFPMPNLTPTKTIGHGIDTVWIYEIKVC
ncbi:ATP synthase subunit C lysine N-methyltransferase [Euwallacea fornicatus]|uniref:ATP synthase subunit C lysine N-methyltransferase n=1 Tax=Euwallacea fornicatus TaxID=995702 RepID=UPI00338F9E42